MESQLNFVIKLDVPHESGGLVADRLLVTNPESAHELSIIDFYFSAGRQAVSIREANATPTNIEPPDDKLSHELPAFKPTLH